MDTATSDIRAVEFSPSSDCDSPVLPELLDQIPDREEIGTGTAYDAYDTRRFHAVIISRPAAANIPIRKNGRAWKEACSAATVRNHALHTALRQSVLEALDRISRPQRNRGHDAVPEAVVERIAARHSASQTAEIQIRVALMKSF